MRIFSLKFIYSIILLLSLYCIPLGKTAASGEFLADYDVQYAISPTGKTIVTQEVNLTNLLPNFYPQEYSLLLDSDKITNVIAYDDGGVITPLFSVKDGKTEIKLTFNVKAIGLGKSIKFSLRYEHGGVASLNGSIWEIYVPGVTNDPDIGTYEMTLAVPPTFGPAAYLLPKPGKGKSWTKDQMIRGGVVAAYGAAQHFDATLTYTLTNGNLTPDLQEIALPPTTAYQRVTIASLEPKPTTVVSDSDGNWLARYEVGARQELTVTAKVFISTFLLPQKGYESKEIGLIDEYVREDEYWQVNNDEIKRLAARLTTPRQIYDYVSTTLSYDYKKINESPKRIGALLSLNEPTKAVCMEFTDLFIAIARAANIPARRIVGFAYTNNPKLRPLLQESDVLHAWPEYYDRSLALWIPVDPTWANTTGGVDYFSKLDFNHIVFAINGVDSQRPYPVGYYRKAGSSGRDVEIAFTNTPQPKAANVSATIEFPDTVGAGRRTTGAIIVTNKGGESAYNINVSALSDPSGIMANETISELLPYGVVRVPMSGEFDQPLTSKSGIIYAVVNDTTLTQNFRIQPIVLVAGLGLLTFILALIVGFFLMKRLVWKHSKK